MARFSERIGAVKPRTVLQVGAMDKGLRIALWNAIDLNLRHLDEESGDVVIEIWRVVLNWAVDEFTGAHPAFRWSEFKRAFMEAPWHLAYDIVEYCNSLPFMHEALVEALERGGSGYRFINYELMPIVAEHEIKEIEAAQSHPIATVRAHLDQALAHLGNRENPDYRNSIKESISAVESVCRLITKQPEARLGDAIRKFESAKMHVHTQLKNALSALYAWTSDAGGIRHALKDEMTPSADEARFMVVICSAYVNYLIAKADEYGIELTPPEK